MTSYPMPGLTLKGVAHPFMRDLVTRFQTRYVAALQSVPSTWADVVSGLTSTVPGESIVNFPIDVSDLGPGMREWIGDRRIERTDLVGFSVEQRKWEKTKGVSKDLVLAGEMNATIRNFVDRTGAIMAAGRSMRPLLVANVLKQGKTKALTYQGIPLFVGLGATTKHWINPLKPSAGTFYNLLTGLDFNADSYEAIKLALNGRKGPDGVSTMGLRLTHVLGGTRMETQFDRVFKREIIANAYGTTSETNIYEGDAIPLIAPELDDDPWVLAGHEVWYAIATNVEARPVEYIADNGGAPNITVFGEESDSAVMHGECLFAGDMNANVGAGLPQTIIRVEGI